jgi:hypothetical protein
VITAVKIARRPGITFAALLCHSAVAKNAPLRDASRVTEYIVFVRICGEWEEVARIEASDHAEAIRKAELTLPAEHQGRPMGLKPIGQSSPRVPLSSKVKSLGDPGHTRNPSPN